MPADPNAPKPIEIQPPIAGVVKKYAVQNQPPYSTPLALNVRLGVGSSMRERIGTRPGLAKHFSQQVGTGPVRHLNAVEWVSSGTLKSTVLASAAGVTRYEQSDGTLSSALSCAGLTTATVTLSASQLVHSSQIGQVLYIADWDPDATISAADRAPKSYTPATNTLAFITASAGTVPKGCPVCARFRGRWVLAGARANPQLFYMSRIDDVTDWDASVTDDPAAAVAGGTGDAFTIGEAITALIPSGDECMVFGCMQSLWILTNDPRDGGAMKKISDKVGIISPGAWCTTPEDAIVFLSHDGLYVMNGGCDHGKPQSVSRERLPAALLNLGQTDKVVNLAYDMFARGVHIWVSPALAAYTTGTITVADGVVTLAGGTWPTWAGTATLTFGGTEYTVQSRDSNTQLTLTNHTIDAIAGTTFSLSSSTANAEHYFFDWQDKGFWPQSFPYAQECTAIHTWQLFATSPSYTTAAGAATSLALNPGTADTTIRNDSTVLIGGRDGYVRRFKVAQTTDDGTAISSYIVYGPFGMGRGFTDSQLREIHATRASGSGNIVWSVFAGSSPEEALESPDRTTSDTWRSDYWNPRAFPRIRGSDYYVKLASDSGSIWSIERVGFTLVGQRGTVRR